MTQSPVTTIAALLTGVIRDPGRPRLTWYGPQGERIELSGAVLDNWVAKTTNLLVEEFDAGPGSRLRLDLPVHWRTLVWALAAWRAGATVLPTDSPADIVVTDRPELHAQADQLVAVALPGLSLRWTGPALPPGAVDAAQAVMTYGDVIGWAPEVDLTAQALPDVRFDRLIAADDAPGARTLLTGDHDVTGLLLTALRVWASGGSVVLAPGADGDRAERIAATEHVEVRA